MGSNTSNEFKPAKIKRAFKMVKQRLKKKHFIDSIQSFNILVVQIIIYYNYLLYITIIIYICNHLL